jgi:hypothetical protein
MKSGNKPKAKSLLSSLILYNPPFKEKALADKDLKPVANEIIEANKPKPKPVEKPKTPAPDVKSESPAKPDAVKTETKPAATTTVK